MTEEKEQLDLPPKPSGPWWRVLQDGAIGAAVGFVMGKFIWRDKLPWMGILLGTGAVNGYFSGKSEEEKYQLTVKNIQLENKLHKLEANGAIPESDKSFVKQVSEKPPEKDCGCPLRS